MDKVRSTVALNEGFVVVLLDVSRDVSHDGQDLAHFGNYWSGFLRYMPEIQEERIWAQNELIKYVREKNMCPGGQHRHQ